MQAGIARSRALWLLPVVLIVGALMIVPTASTLGVSTPASGSVAPTAPAPALSPSRSISGSPILHSSPLSPSSSAVTSLSRSIQRLESSNAGPGTVQLVQKVRSGIASGALNPRTVYLPNFNLLAQRVSSPAQAISLAYTASPAPMGISDFGIGSSSAYSYNTSAVQGQAVLDSFNATAGGLYEATGGYYWSGYSFTTPGNPYQSGMQLNTVLANVTFPGSSADPLGSGVFWTQNVPDFEGNSIQFIDNVWNFSTPGAGMNSSTLLSYDGVLVPGEFYYDVGPTIPAVFPLTMQLYNNVSVVSGQDVLTYGYRVVEPGQTYTGVYDTIVFNSPAGSTTALSPAFRVDGNHTTPGGAALFDSELVFTGPGAGSNAVITNLTGQLSMSYLTSQGSWAAPRATYDYGGNTGETAIGVAATWSGTTVNVVQGPSFLYGLWGATHAVPSGAISFTGLSNPNYAFTFMAESASGTFSNFAYAPSNASGVVATMLPPSLPAPYTSYGLAAFADEFASFTTSFSGAQANYPITLVSSPGTLDAPLYMNGEAQATALATAVDGAANAPYTFSNLVLKLDPYTGHTFNLLNDWGFTTFNLVQTQGVTTPLVFDHVAQGPNQGTSTEYYDSFRGGSTVNIPNGSQEFVDYGGTGDQFRNLELPGYVNPIGVTFGGAISLWGTADVSVTNVSATNFSYGVWASGTAYTTVTDSTANNAAAFSILASTGAVGFNLSATDHGAGVFAEGSTGATLSFLNASASSDGVVGYWMNGTAADQLVSQAGSQAAYLEGGIGFAFDHVSVNDLAYGVIGLNVTNLRASDGSSYNDSVGVALFNATGAAVTGEYANYSVGVYFELVGSSGISVVTAVNGSVGSEINASSDITVGGVLASENDAIGTLVENGSSAVTISGTSATASSTGVEILASSDVTVTGTNASDLSVGVVAEYDSVITVSGTTASTESLGVAFAVVTQGTINDSTAYYLSIPVVVVDSVQVVVSGVLATNSPPTALYDPYAISIFDLPFAAVLTGGDTESTVTNVTASGYGAAYFDAESYALSVSKINSSSDQYAAVLNGTSNSLLTGITSQGDWQGVLMELQNGFAAEDNTLTASHFANDTSYGVDLAAGAVNNTVYNNGFVQNNGATSAYNPSAIQAFSYGTNYFYTCTGSCTTGIGNYWADWHTYGPNGRLAPYPITGSVSDLFPLGPAETFSLTFTETGLSSGAKWSVAVNGITVTSTNATITVSVPMGTYTYSATASGYNAAPSIGSVNVTGPGQSVAVSFSAATSYATASSLTTYFTAALAIAVVALLLALLALFWRRKPTPSTANPPPMAWNPPPAAQSGAPPPGATGGPGGSAGPGSSSWSEETEAPRAGGPGTT